MCRNPILTTPKHIPEPVRYDRSRFLEMPYSSIKPLVSPYVNQVQVDESTLERDKRLNSSPLPYLILNLHVIQLTPQEVRMKAVRGARDSFINRKVKPGNQIKIEIGFVVDLKDRTIEFEYEIVFLNEKRDPQSRIHLFVDEDGTFKINGEVRGRF